MSCYIHEYCFDVENFLLAYRGAHPDRPGSMDKVEQKVANIFVSGPLGNWSFHSFELMRVLATAVAGKEPGLFRLIVLFVIKHDCRFGVFGARKFGLVP